jgi:hypothetical protein
MQTKRLKSAHHSDLTKSQRALAAARQVLECAQDARKQRKAGIGALTVGKTKATESAAKEFAVSTRSVELALAVLRFGDPDLIRGVERGKISVRQAAGIASFQSQVCPSMLKLFALRARVFRLADDPNQWAKERLECLEATWRPQESDEEDTGPCPRCHGEPGAGCLLCFQMPVNV